MLVKFNFVARREIHFVAHMNYGYLTLGVSPELAPFHSYK